MTDDDGEPPEATADPVHPGDPTGSVHPDDDRPTGPGPARPSGRRRGLRAIAATVASLILPGAGHLVVGSRRVALYFLVPTVIVLVLASLWALSQGAYGIAAVLVTPGALTALFALNILVAGWRAAAAVDALGRAGAGRLAVGVSLAIIAAAVVVPAFAAGSLIAATSEFLDDTFAMTSTTGEVEETPGPTPEPTPEPTPTPTLAPGATPPPATPTPEPTLDIAPFPTDGGNGSLPAFDAKIPWDRPGEIPWGDDGRFDLLLIGSDAGASRWSRRNDVMLLVEVDVKTGATAMVGLPRNLQNAPYPKGPARNASACGCQPGLLNEMYVEATARNPGLWPGKGAVKGIGAVRSVVSEITGRPIDAVLIVDLVGVIRVVDAMGGIDIDVSEAVVDDRYPDPGNGSIKLRIKTGRQHFDGHLALAYARSRHMDSDYGRMRRQQELLMAIREQLGPSVILNAPALFGAARGTAWTDLPRESIPALIELFGRAADAKVKHLRIVPPAYPSFMTAAWVTQIRKDVAALLPGTPKPDGASYPRAVATPRPTPRPTPKPTPKPKPTTAPTAEPTAEPTVEPTPEATPEPDPEPTPEP